MSVVKRIVCLANSRKLQGRCIAGRELVGTQPGGWIRPVSSREHEEVSEYERQYEDGSDPRLLDIIDVPLLKARPRDYQQENWRLDPDWYWEKVGQFPRGRLQKLADPAADLWINGYSSSSGLNDRIPLRYVAELESSLRLVRARDVELCVFRPGNRKRRVQARFNQKSTEYRLWITDPDFQRRYLAKADASYDIGDCFLTISLGEQYGGYCYKLVAAIIPRI